MHSIQIDIGHKGEDYINVSINGDEKEIHAHDGQAIELLLKAIKTLWQAYA